MSWLSFIEPLTSIVKEPLVEWQKRKTLEVAQVDKELEREHELNVKKIEVNYELAKNGMNIAANSDITSQKAMKTTYKDEWFVALFSIPLILAFVPEYQGVVLKGFDTLSKTPDWYMWLVTGMVSATFGLRFMFNKINFKGK